MKRAETESLASAYMKAGLDCPFSVQSAYLEMLRVGYGARFLFISSLHCAYGLGGYYTSPSKGHFQFLTEGLPLALGVQMQCQEIDAPSRGLGPIGALMRAHGPVVIPINLRHHPRFSKYGQEDFPYMVILKRHHGGSFEVRDNLDRSSSSSLWHFDDSTIEHEHLELLFRSYAEVGLSLEWMPDAPSSWALFAESMAPLEESNVAEDGSSSAAGWIVERYQDLEVGVEVSAEMASEVRHWAAILRAESAGERCETYVKQYLMEDNFAQSHLDLLAHALAALGADGRPALKAEVERARARKQSLRMRLVVDALAGRLVAKQRMGEIEELANIDSQLRGRVLELVGQLPLARA